MGIDFIPINDDPSISPLEIKILTYEGKHIASVEIACELLESSFSRWQGLGNKVLNERGVAVLM